MAFNDKILEAKANKFRRELGLGTESSLDLQKLLLNLGILTVYKSLEGEFSGMALKTNENLFMLINSALPVGRQNFTIGHELYHLFIQSDFNFQMCNAGKFDKKDKEEYNADIFSSYFLMPDAALIKQIPEKELGWGETLSLATIIKMEQYFGVSRSALLVRLSKAKYIHYDDYKQYLNGVIKSAVEHGYSSDLYVRNDVNKVIGDYGTKAKALYDVDKISESHYHSLMLDIGLDIDDPKYNDYGKEN
jgi:Zn-dependent peptidase ImmA (M78 family)